MTQPTYLRPATKPQVCDEGKDPSACRIKGPEGQNFRGVVWRCANHFRTFVTDLNGQRGIVLRQRGRVEAAVSFAYNQLGRATDIYIVRNPEKLASLGKVRMH